MRKHPILPAILLLFFYCVTAAQESGDYRLFLKSGAFTPAKNITSFTDQYNKRIARSGIQYFTIIQFDKIPDAGQREQLRQAGIELLDYIPNNAYTATVRGSLNTAVLQAANARAIVELAPEQKIAGSLAKGVFPSWAIKSAGTLDVWVHFPASIPAENVLAQLREKNFDIISTIHKNYGILGLRIASTRLKELAAESYIAYVQAAPPADQALNDPGRNDARADVLNASAISGGYDLRGEGVVIGVGDDSDPLRHIDFTNRLIDRTVAVGGGHGLHVMGTAGGAGIIEERYAGFAPKATIVSQYFSGIFANAPGYVQDYNMVVTNNSYGAIVGDCSYSGVYDFYSYYLDRQAMDLPHLQNVFAAGNDGGLACSLYPPGFGTVLGSYQSAKNVIDVGNTFANGTISGTSSKGPVKDGRIKPEICAMGTGVTSTWPVNTYAGNSGTSMASPAVSGGLALLYQRYRQLNGNADPPNALMKALVCNGATDLGNPGPDYSYGFGWLNLIRSADMLNNHHYVIASIGNGNKNAHTITIPANTAQVKVMLYWNDPAASPLAGRTLVNDLDLKVVTPSSATVLPFVLDTA
ncbi:MAG TPA: S8 family serine peptidase, partial [Sediminibacterium sp.]|nr:S8 family serine peptidase [Sediminibacterium sp.]